MERLTERTSDGILVKEDYGEDVLKTLYQCYGAEVIPHYANCDEGYCAMEKLAAYEDAEEQGLLLKLPCKVGDMVYVPHRGKIQEMIIQMVSWNGTSFFFSWTLNSGIYPWLDGFGDMNIGKTVFLTQAEAEQKLKEMKS